MYQCWVPHHMDHSEKKDEQKEALEKEFETNKYLDTDEMTYLAKRLNLEHGQVKNWFANRNILDTDAQSFPCITPFSHNLSLYRYT